MPEQESFLQLKSEIQALKIKDEYRTKELDALLNKLDNSTNKLNDLSENIGRLLAGQDLHKTSDNEVRDELKLLHQSIKFLSTELILDFQSLDFSLKLMDRFLFGHELPLMV